MIEQLEMAQMTLPKGIRNEVKELQYCTVSEVTVEDEEGAQAIGREKMCIRDRKVLLPCYDFQYIRQI